MQKSHLFLKPSILMFLLTGLPASVFACEKSETTTTNQTPSIYKTTSNNQCLIYDFYGGEVAKSITWNGLCKDGYASGAGTATWLDSKRKPIIHIDTEFDHGNMNKTATIVWDQENDCQFKRYEGEMHDNIIRGQGTFEFSDGNRFVGEMVPNGSFYKGVFTWGKDSQWAGDRYEGGFINGERQGYGIYTSGIFTDWAKRGIVFEPSEFKNPTDFDEDEGDRYEGQWKDHKQNGKGTFINKIFRYDGDFVDNEKSGHGIGYWYNNKSRYEGEWKDNRPYGKGKITDNNGSWYKGEFLGDYLQSNITGNGELHFVSGSVAVGSFINGKIWGFNTLTVPKSAYTLPTAKRSPLLGKWVSANTYVEQGWFVDNKLAFSCQNEQDCHNIAKTDPKKQQIITDTEEKRKEFLVE